MVRLFIYNSDFYNVQISRCVKKDRYRAKHTHTQTARCRRMIESHFFRFLSFQKGMFVVHAYSFVRVIANLLQSESNERFSGVYWSA